jgi:hypothetical protein
VINDTVTIRASRALAAQVAQRARAAGVPGRALVDAALRAALAMWKRDGVVLGKTTEGGR